MKKPLFIIFVIAAIFGITQLVCDAIGSWRFEKDYLQHWNLADKSSTLEAKQKFVQTFVASLEFGFMEGEFSTHNALFLKTPNNEFQANLEAVRTLAKRLDEIQDMDPNSFEYNTAIQQITAQEQGEAERLLSVFKGCYFLHNYIICWEWIGVTLGVLSWTYILGMCMAWGIMWLDNHS